MCLKVMLQKFILIHVTPRQSHRSWNVDCICKIGNGLESQLVNYLSMLFVAKRQMQAWIPKKSETQVIK